MLFNEPKLLKYDVDHIVDPTHGSFSALQRAEIAEIFEQRKGTSSFLSFSALQRAEIAEILAHVRRQLLRRHVSVLFNEPKLLKFSGASYSDRTIFVSVLFNEPKLLKLDRETISSNECASFSALQRAEIAEIHVNLPSSTGIRSFSALQRAEIAEIEERSRDRSERRPFQCSSTSRNC